LCQSKQQYYCSKHSKSYGPFLLENCENWIKKSALIAFKIRLFVTFIELVQIEIIRAFQVDKNIFYESKIEKKMISI